MNQAANLPGAPTPAAPIASIPSPPPAKSRRGLLLVISAIFAMWVGMMLVMYFTTVYPHRHSANPAAAAATLP